MTDLKNKKINNDSLSKINGGFESTGVFKVYCTKCRGIIGTFETRSLAVTEKNYHAKLNPGHFCSIRSNDEELPVTPSKSSFPIKK